MSFELDPIYLIWMLFGLSAMLSAEAVYLTCFSGASYRKQVNRRLSLNKNSTDRESALVAWRRERGLTHGGDYILKFVALNRLILQSGITIGMPRLMLVVALSAVAVFAAEFSFRGDLVEAAGASLLSATALPYAALRLLRGRRQKKFAAQLPDALDTIVRSLQAGHPVPTAISMVGREMADPIGGEFGVATDEITYGADLEAALRNLYVRVGSDDLPLFITAVGIQNSSGGNLGEILQNLSSVIRQRFKMRRKVRSLAAEGRASAMILSALPIGLFIVIQITSPEFYAAVWHIGFTKILLGGAATWMLIGNLIMFKMVNFKI
jgi:tight adherence protein B